MNSRSPPQRAPTTVYYFFDGGGTTVPAGGNDAPFIYFVSNDHFGDLDSRQELLDVFDIARLMRHLAWGEPLPDQARLDLTEDGNTDTDDLAAAVSRLLPQASDPFGDLQITPQAAVMRLSDGSSLAMPRDFRGRQTDLVVEGNLAGALISRHERLTQPPAAAGNCPLVEGVRVNNVFYRREPHEMRRYTALAFDNIRRDPLAFASASAYRMVRLFIIRGTDDQMTTHQFPLSRLIFQAGLVASLVYFAAFLAGVVLAWRARSPFLYALIPIVYVPLTICFVLTNMRYTITVQPLMFVFVAITVAAVLRLGGPVTEPFGSRSESLAQGKPSRT